MITALSVANYILEQAKKDNISVTPMKLQKLIYILYKEYLKETEKKLFSEKFLVWKHGPVLESVYHAFSRYKANPIQEYYSEETGRYKTVNPTKTFKKVFKVVWERHKQQDGIYLSMLTHQKGAAWSKARDEGRGVLKTQDIFEEKTYA